MKQPIKHLDCLPPTEGIKAYHKILRIADAPSKSWGLDRGKPARMFIGLRTEGRNTWATVWMPDCKCRYPDCILPWAMHAAGELSDSASVERVPALHAAKSVKRKLVKRSKKNAPKK